MSGLAQGVDGAAHEAAIQAGGRTIAVIGTPLDRVFPREHARLQEQIYRDHLLVSQFPSGSRISSGNYIARRTMALLCQASVIVEADDASGTLSQAAEVQRLGRPLFLMRSILDRTDLTWPARFLAAGAIVLERAEQVLEAISDSGAARAATARLSPRPQRLEEHCSC